MESKFVAPTEKEGEYTAFDVRINHACCYLCLAESGHCSVGSLLFLFQINKGITVTLLASSCLSDRESPSQRVPTKTRSLCHCQWLHCALLSFSFWSLVLSHSRSPLGSFLAVQVKDTTPAVPICRLHTSCILGPT